MGINCADEARAFRAEDFFAHRNCGMKTTLEIIRWAGLNEPKYRGERICRDYHLARTTPREFGNLSNRAQDACRRNGIETAEQAAMISLSALSSMPGIGRKLLREIKDWSAPVVRKRREERVCAAHSDYLRKRGYTVIPPLLP
jgi:hypothetical protein